MRIQKIGRKIVGAGRNCNPTRLPLNIKSTRTISSPDLGAGSEDDSDEFYLVEEYCELALVEGQTFSIPYELYDLPDLKEILSVNTWDSCLSEEEKLFLSAHLPDTDQKTFASTLKELLSGTDLYFGNPMEMFFKGLKGGLYPPKVACLRECLNFIQRKKYYNFLRSYHENMIQIFKGMKRVWDQLEKKSSVGERLFIWSRWKKHQDLNLLDLNTVPTEENNMDATSRLSDRMKSMEGKEENNGSPLSLDDRSKGILNVKASKNSMFQTHSPKVVFNDMLELYQSVPKGLLKVVPKVPPTQAEQHQVAPRHLLPKPLPEGSKSKKSSSLQGSIYSNIVGLPSRRRRFGGSNVHTNSVLPECVLNREDTLRISGSIQRPIKRVKRKVDPLLDSLADSREQTRLGDDVNKEFPFGVQSYFREQNLHSNGKKHVSVGARLLETTGRVLEIGREMTTTSLSKPKNGQSNVNMRKPLSVLSKHNETEEIKDDHLFCLTYKRRKVFKP